MSSSASFVEHLTTLLRARTPVLHLSVVDQARALRLLRRASAGRGFLLWRCSRGLEPDPVSAPGAAAIADTLDLPRALDAIAARAAASPEVYAILDPGLLLQDPAVVRRIRDLAELLSVKTRSHLVLVDDRDLVPGPLDRFVVDVEVPLADAAELREHLDRILAGMERQRSAPVEVGEAEREAICGAALGLTILEFENLVARGMVERGCLGGEDLESVVETKARLLRRVPLIEATAPRETLSSVGGAGCIKGFLGSVELGPASRRPRTDPGAGDDTAARGVLLVGLPGSGKGHILRAAAGSLGLPLVRLDGALLRVAGVASIRDALRAVERMRPLLVWIDGLEDLLAAAEPSGLAACREVIEWLRSPRPGILAGATISDVDRLGEAHIRAPAFDRVYFLDLPGPGDRGEILRVLLRRARIRGAGVDLPAVVEATRGLVAAEIEQVVREARRAAGGGGVEPDTAHFAEAAGRIRPLSAAMEPSLTALRAWSAGHAHAASSEASDVGP